MPKHMIDPPSGWRYGFPKAYDRLADGDDLMAWLVKEGYPQAEIDRMGEHFHVRQWYESTDDDPGFQRGIPINQVSSIVDVVILVDCWDGQLGKVDLRSGMYANIDRAIKSIDPGLIVLASYASSEYYDPALRDNVWFRNFWNEFPDFVEHRRWFYRTHQTILQARYNGYQIFLTQMSQFDQVLTTKDIRPSRIWYFGNHWNSCLMQQEIGYKNMQVFCQSKFGQPVPILFREDCMLYRLCIDGVHADQEIYPDVANDQITNCISLGQGVWQLHKFVDIFV